MNRRSFLYLLAITIVPFAVFYIVKKHHKVIPVAPAYIQTTCVDAFGDESVPSSRVEITSTDSARLIPVPPCPAGSVSFNVYARAESAKGQLE
jgi:hypothetical protein